jgi:tripartite-type tricarboxylate transporter receptor subunit TctC
MAIVAHFMQSPLSMPRAARRFCSCLVAAFVCWLAQPSVAGAQSYPARPVRIIVPFAPSGTTDIFARIAAQKLTERLGKTFYVENIAGASGNIGTAQAARAAPDGYTVLFAFSSHVVNPSLFAKIAYDPIKPSTRSRLQLRLLP